MSNSRKSPYSALGLERSATKKEIKKAYHGLMLQYHPDKYRGDPQVAQDKANELIAAFEVLSDAQSRERYDRIGFTDDNSFQRAPKTRDTNTPLDKDFSISAFISTIAVMAWGKNNVALANYFDDNLTDLEATINQPVYIQNICAALNNQTYVLITHFNADWLKRLPGFGRAEFMGSYLNQLSTDHWQTFLDHLGKDWLYSQLNGNELKTLMGYFTGYRAMNISLARDQQREMFCNYLGLEWLRLVFTHPEHLGNFLSDNNFHKSHNQMLTFIDGQDQWLRQTYTDPAQIGILLTTMASYEEHQGLRMPTMFGIPAAPRKLASSTKDKWYLISSYIMPEGFQQLADNPVTLNALIRHMENEFSVPPNTKKIELFLEIYFRSDSMNEIEQLITLFNTNPLAAEKEIQLAKSIVLMQACSSQQLKKIFLELRDFPTLMVMIDSYKDQIWYRAILLGVAKALLQDREDNPAAYTSMFGFILGYSREQKLIAAKSLINSILNNTDIEDVPGIAKGKLGELCQRYQESRTPKESLRVMASMLL